MAYNLQSLITILQRILDPQQTHWILGPDEKPQLQSLIEKASFLQQQILEKSLQLLTKIPSLECQIRDVANQAEDIVESHMVERLLSMPEGVKLTLLTPDVLLVIQKLNSVIEQVEKLVEVETNKKPTGSSSSGASFSSVVVGVDEDLMQLKDRLTGMQSKLEIVPIVGMGGIGKTTLARTLYQDPSIVELSRSVIRRGFLESIPNIKSLGIMWYELEGLSGMSEVVDLSHLHKLQTLTWSSTGMYEYVHVPKFPSTLRKLNLRNCVITVVATMALCALPNLKVLKIYDCTFKSNETNAEWEIAEGDEFRSLQFLQLTRCYSLVHWRADETNFPRLRHLFLRGCRDLEEIPAGIGEIPTLQLIHLVNCSDSAVASAKQIQKEQQSEYDNYDLQLRIISE